jgi:Transposase DDE domain group 1
MGDAESGPVRLSFNSQLRVEFRGATVTSDAGLLLPRELDERLGLSALIDRHLTDPRTGRNRQFPLADLFRQSVYSRLAGYEDTNDAERLAEDPAFRMLASRERRDISVALTSTLHWFETDVLANERNYRGLSRLNTDLVQPDATRPLIRRVTLDIDRSESPVHDAQEESAYNGHFESVCYHPLFVFNQDGDCLTAKRRPGNVHSAEGWDEVLLPVIDRLQDRGQTVVVRADAAFAIPALYEALEQRGVTYAIRLPANQVLERTIEDLLTRPRGRPSHAPLVRYRTIQYQAASWDRPRRVIAKVEHHLGELFPRVGFIVTTLTGTNRAVVRFYNQRGTAEQWIKEGKAATNWTHLSCHRFRANEVGCSWASSPTTSAISCVGLSCRPPSRAGR